jgi:type I restriction enzyme M protein
MHYTEQISWILFLKFLDDFEEGQRDAAELDGKEYKYILDHTFRWSNWIHRDKWLFSGDDLKDFVNKELFPYLKSFRNVDADYHSIKYKIGEIFFFLDNRIESGHTLREILDIIDGMNFQSQEDIFELSKVYEDLLQGMGNDGGNSWEFYTPRSIIKLIVDIVDPKVWQTVYDPAAGSCGFLIEAFNHIRPQVKTDSELEFLGKHTFFWNEKAPLAYILGVMNMILHGVHNPNISKINTLTTNTREIQDKDRYDIILANPPFGGKEKEQIQKNFQYPTNATEMLFLQHICEDDKRRKGKQESLVPEWVLFNTWWGIQECQERRSSRTTISIRLSHFLPEYSSRIVEWRPMSYSSIRSAVLEISGTMRLISDVALTKNKPIRYEELSEIVLNSSKEIEELTPNSWIVKVEWYQRLWSLGEEPK